EEPEATQRLSGLMATDMKSWRPFNTRHWPGLLGCTTSAVVCGGRVPATSTCPSGLSDAWSRETLLLSVAEGPIRKVREESTLSVGSQRIGQVFKPPALVV